MSNLLQILNLAEVEQSGEDSKLSHATHLEQVFHVGLPISSNVTFSSWQLASEKPNQA